MSHLTDDLAVSDVKANFTANGLAGLQALAAAGQFGTVTILDATDANSALALTLTGTQLATDVGVLTKIGNDSFYTLTVSGAVTAAQAAVASGLTASLAAPLAVTDTGAQVTANFAGLRTLAAANELGTVALSDNKLTLISTQLLSTNASTVLGLIYGNTYRLTVTGTMTAAQATGLGAITSHLSGTLAVRDSGANVTASG